MLLLLELCLLLSLITVYSLNQKCKFDINQTFTCDSVFDWKYYRSFNKLNHINSSSTAWSHFLSTGISLGLPIHPPPRIIKLILLTKDEWPMLKSWVLYHGYLVGYQNLYIISGCTEYKPLQFLAQIKRIHPTINILYTQAGLDKLNKYIQSIFIQLRYTTDLITKLDTDEFISLYHNSSSFQHSSTDLNKYLTYTLPYDISGRYFFGYHLPAIPVLPDTYTPSTTTPTTTATPANSISTTSISTGQTSSPTPTTMSRTPTSPLIRDASLTFQHFKHIRYEPKYGKVMFYSPIFEHVDLGCHRGSILPRYRHPPLTTSNTIDSNTINSYTTISTSDSASTKGNTGSTKHTSKKYTNTKNTATTNSTTTSATTTTDVITKLVYIHFHHQDLTLLQNNNKKALLSHGYILYNDTILQQIYKCKTILSTYKCHISCHKLKDYYTYLINPTSYARKYYFNMSDVSRDTRAYLKYTGLSEVLRILHKQYDDTIVKLGELVL